MPSSISSSEIAVTAAPHRTPKRYAFALLCLVVTLLLAWEGITRTGFDRISRIQRRMSQERHQAVENFSNSSTSSARTLLLVGNSLMLEGVDPERFHADLLPNVNGLRYVVEQSDYYDWYYGLKRLFAEGARPNYVALGLAPFQLNSNAIRGDYSAHYLFKSRDIISYAVETKLGLNATSSLLVAHYSRAYAVREETRVYLLTKLFPEYVTMLHSVTVQPARKASGDQIRASAAKRLRALSDMCAGYGVKPILVIPPTGYGAEPEVTAAGQSAGVPVLVPVQAKEFGPEYFQADHFHLNEAGRNIFTVRLVRDLKQQLH